MRSGLFLFVVVLVGCDTKLETGYVQRKLNASDAERRAYYAPEYTPESHPVKDSSTPTVGAHP